MPSISPQIPNITIYTTQTIEPQPPKTIPNGTETTNDTLTPSTINEEISTTYEPKIIENKSLYKAKRGLKAGYIVAIIAACIFAIWSSICLICLFCYQHSKNQISSESTISALKSLAID